MENGKASETLLEALCRELKEELGVSFTEDQFVHLGSVLSKTSTDGVYGLHLYHAEFPDNFEPEIDLAEHLAYQWVTLEEFKYAPLLHAQGEAFLFVEEDANKHHHSRLQIIRKIVKTRTLSQRSDLWIFSQTSRKDRKIKNIFREKGG